MGCNSMVRVFRHVSLGEIHRHIVRVSILNNGWGECLHWDIDNTHEEARKRWGVYKELETFSIVIVHTQRLAVCSASQCSLHRHRFWGWELVVSSGFDRAKDYTHTIFLDSLA
jgi:hypothetical protein